eukprot:7642593-Pyramimonas_sp.AAC.1
MEAFLGQQLDFRKLEGAPNETDQTLTTDLGQEPQIKWAPARGAEGHRRYTWRSFAGPPRWLKNKLTDARRALDELDFQNLDFQNAS